MNVMRSHSERFPEKSLIYHCSMLPRHPSVYTSPSYKIRLFQCTS
nr:MAG TPA: hypothetical protein [Bacteriophage sp.]